MKENEVLRRRAEDSSSIILHNFSTNGTSSKKKMESNKLVKKKKRASGVNQKNNSVPIRPVRIKNASSWNSRKTKMESRPAASTRRSATTVARKGVIGRGHRPRLYQKKKVRKRAKVRAKVRAKKRTSPDRTQDKKNHSKYSFYYSSIPLNCFLFSLLYSTPMSL